MVRALHDYIYPAALEAGYPQESFTIFPTEVISGGSMPASTADINKETDARFWANTGYKPGQKLDASDPLDKAMIPEWIKYNERVKADDKAGTLVLTYQHPSVSQPLAAATAIADIADDHHEQAQVAAASGDAPAAEAHAQVAAVASQAQDQLTSQARTEQATVRAAPPAARGDWTITSYGTAADALFAAFAKAHGGDVRAAVVSLGKNGNAPQIRPYPTSDAASSAYDAAVDKPGDRWYVALYDHAKAETANGRVDETYFGGVNAAPVTRGPLQAVVAVALAGGIAVFAGRKKHKKGSR